MKKKNRFSLFYGIGTTTTTSFKSQFNTIIQYIKNEKKKRKKKYVMDDISKDFLSFRIPTVRAFSTTF